MTSLESQDLFCRSGCGFYGNPEWNWYCSKCWREHNGPQAASPAKRSSPIGKSESFSKFEDKKKRHTLDRNFKHIFRKKEGKEFPSPAKNNNNSTGSSQSANSQSHRSSTVSRSDRSTDFSPEAKAVSQEFTAFLSSRLAKPGIVDLSQAIKAIIDRIAKKADVLPIDEVSNAVQDFYRRLQKKLEGHQHFQSLSEEDQITILDYSERLITTCSYKSLFCPPTSDDEEKDLEIQNRIRSLNWISTKDLKCSMSETSQEVRDLLYKSINDILEMDGKIAPQDKMECLVRCCKTIFQMLKESNSSPASADDFLPCLIYVCLKANPPRIQSNINFITKFCNENKLRMGEGGYFFANLCCALSFISTLDASSVNMGVEEFESYVSGRAMPPGSWESSLLMCEGLQVMSQNLKTLSDLALRHDRVTEEAHKLQEEMSSFERHLAEEVESVLKKTEVTFKVGPLLDIPPQEEEEDETDGQQNNSKRLPNIRDPLLEDFLGNKDSTTNKGGQPDNVSLLSFDNVSDASTSFPTSSRHRPQDREYRGFSAQSCSIPSIPCDNAVSSIDETNEKDLEVEEEEQKDPHQIEATSSSSPEEPKASSEASSTFN